MLDRTKKIIQIHYLVIFLCLFIGLISSLPRYIGGKNTTNFQGIYNQIVGDEAFYDARAKDILDGHYPISNPYIYEHKNDLPIEFWIPDYILAKPIGWLGLSVPEGFILWNFILTFILALLSYIALFILTRSISWSLLGTTLLHLVLFNGDFIRLPSPGLNFVFWLLTFIFLLLYLDSEKPKHAIFASFFFGTLFHTYPYYWTFYTVLLGVFIVLSLILRLNDFSYKKLFFVILGGFAVSSPYLVSFFKSLKSIWYDETLARLGLISSHFPSGISIVLVTGVSIIFFLYLYFKKEIDLNKQNVFIFSGLLAGAISVNQHIITGKNLEFSSHYYMSVIFWSIFAVVYGLSIFFKKYPENIQRTFLYTVSITLFVLALLGTYKLVVLEMVYSEGDVYVQNYKPVFDWLKENTPTDSVVFTNDNLSYYIPIYTANDVFFNAHGILFFMSNSEANERFIMSHYFDTFTPEYVVDKQRMIFGGYYINEYKHNLSKNKVRKLLGMKTMDYIFIPSIEIEKIITEAKIIQKESFDKALGSYKVDYIVWDRNINPKWKLERFEFLKPLYTANNIIVYSLK